MSIYSEVGSEWHRWDLHVHTKASYDYKYNGEDADEMLCRKLYESGVSAVAITDHFKIDSGEITHLRQICRDKNYNICFFPGVELRTDKGANNLHLILIFPMESNLTELEEDFNAIMLRQKAHNGSDLDKIFWSFEDIICFANEHGAIITIHAGHKSNGIDREISLSDAVPVKEAIKDEIAQKIDFFEMGRPDDLETYRVHVLPYIGNKPMIICSDNHNPVQYNVKAPLWIKGDICLDTLRQCILQPEERVFVGDKPPLLCRIERSPASSIRSVYIHPKSETVKGGWFNQKIALNPGMVAIIGNKGNGKSALSDILALGCHCDFRNGNSFLSDQKFGRRSSHFAEKYEASLEWRDEKITNYILSDYRKSNGIPEADYLPQNRIEELCNDLEDAFQQEVNRVIFANLTSVLRKGKINLQDLLDSETVALRSKGSTYRQRLHELNHEIVTLEMKGTSSYKKNLQAALDKANEDLKRHDQVKPKEVKKPDTQEAAKMLKEINSLKHRMDELNRQIQQVKESINGLDREIEVLQKLELHMDIVKNEYITFKDEVEKYIQDFDIFGDENKDFDLQLPETFIVNRIAELQDRRSSLLSKINENGKENLASERTKLSDTINNMIAGTTGEEKKYADYVNALTHWEQKRLEIVGDESKPNSLTALQKEWKYIEDGLKKDLESLCLERKKQVSSIFQCLQEEKNKYEMIFQPVKEMMDNSDEFSNLVAFSPRIITDDVSFKKQMLSQINSQYGGVFHGKSDADAALQNMLDERNLESWEDVWGLVEKIAREINHDFDISFKKVKDKEAFYDYLFGLSYLSCSYKLEMDGKGIEDLSPGERGILLLTFYLTFSQDERPIIIDQPEDNLDNQSIYSRLVPAIRHAKQKRQVIIVTHNPNIAIACDADQIVYSHMDKEKQEIRYTSGSIENLDIRKKVIDVLEGTMPAFNLRKNKYEWKDVSFKQMGLSSNI